MIQEAAAFLSAFFCRLAAECAMSKLFSSNAHSIGNTPLVRLANISLGKATILAKVEGRNPAFSIKDRVALKMLDEATKEGKIKPGVTIVEPTSGNTGIGLAFLCAVRGLRCILTMPETMSIERRRVLAMLGAELILTDGSRGMAGAIACAEEMVASDPHAFFMPQQFTNPANPKAHEETTAPEIWDATGGNVDVLVAGVGTGGTITGIARYFKKTQKKNLFVVAVEPAQSPVLTQYFAKQPLKPGPHQIQGIGAGFVPAILDCSLIDRVEAIDDESAFAFARRLAKEEGILAGISSGAAVACAAKLSSLPEFEGKTICVILPDAGERYMSSALFAGLGEAS